MVKFHYQYTINYVKSPFLSHHSKKNPVKVCLITILFTTPSMVLFRLSTALPDMPGHAPYPSVTRNPDVCMPPSAVPLPATQTAKPPASVNHPPNSQTLPC